MNTEQFVNRLLQLGWRHGDLPIYGSPEWEALDNIDPRRFASVVRAAEAWRRDSTDQALKTRLKAELEEADLLIRWRIRTAGLDVHAAHTERKAAK